MNELERTHPQSNPSSEPSAGPSGSSGLNELRRQAAALAAAGDAAIQKALSTNSEAFLASMRQEGGQ